jgi:D-sedoheptulose 7-phosphate isomerase
MDANIFEDLYKRHPDLTVCHEQIVNAFHILRNAFKQNGKVLVCGNGGSASDSEHIVGELMKGFMNKRPIPAKLKEQLIEAYQDEGKFMADSMQGALPAISLVSQSSIITAFANDVCHEMVFAQLVYGYGRKGDVLIGISTSGNSKNVVYAIKLAKLLGLSTIGLTGKTGGEMKELCDVCICAPWEKTPDVQEKHLPIYHTICKLLEKEFFVL